MAVKTAVEVLGVKAVAKVMVKATAVLPLVKEVKVAAEVPRVKEVVKTVARIPQVKVARGYKPKAGPVILAVVNECAEEARR